MNLLLVVGGGFVLLVVGTLLGRYYTPDRRPLKQAAAEGQSYVRGLVEVLDGNHDKAIGEIARALRHNTRNVEPYFALGALFRQRQEFERAVRVHQAILVRHDLNKATRLKVHRQLAMDFFEAGFPKRAIKALEWVVAQDKRQADAWKQLAGLYEDQRQWDRAALALSRVAKLGDAPLAADRGHLWAQQATLQLDGGQMGEARASLRRAVSADADSVHVLAVLARFQEKRGNMRAAARAWEKALRKAPDLASFLYPQLERVRLAQGRLERAQATLEDLARQHPQNAHLNLMRARILARNDPDAALKRLAGLLDEYPSLLPAHREAGLLALQQKDPVGIRRSLERVLAMLQRADHGFRCQECGHTDDDLFWRCPSCQAWGSASVAWGRRAGEA